MYVGVVVCELVIFVLFKQKTAYEMRISDWSSDVCSSDLVEVPGKEIPVETIGRFCAGIVVSHRRDGATVIVDMGGGYGGPMYEHLRDKIGRASGRERVGQYV